MAQAFPSDTRLEDAAAADAVRKLDRDRYWSALFAPAERRPALLAVYAFNAELTRISLFLSEPMVAQIRLQWWRDAIDLAAPGVKTGNPIADAFSRAIVRHNLPKDQLTAMVDARLIEIFNEPIPDRRALRNYLDAVTGSVFSLATIILGVSPQAIEKASQAATTAYGIVELLRVLPLQLARNRCLLPRDLLSAKSADVGQLLESRHSPGLDSALLELRSASGRALSQFVSLAQDLPLDSRPAFLPLALVNPYLRAMSKPGFDLLRAQPSVPPIKRLYKLWRASLSETALT